MNIRKIVLIFSFVVALRADAAMVRVVAVLDGRTLAVERAGVREQLTLAGVAIADEKGARTMLEWTLVSRWISLEEAPGGVLAYRSPDALFVNRELVLRGYARATLPVVEPQTHVPVTYLGTLDLPGPRPAAAAAGPRVRTERGSGSGSDRPRRPRAARPPRRRSGK
jgi:hypothetical protein